MDMPYWLLRLLPMWEYICPKCKKEVKQSAHECPHCGEKFPLAIRVPPTFLKDTKKLEAYVHKHIFPRVSAFERNYLTKYFTVIFSDGFESGNFNAWTGTVTAAGDTLEVSNTQKHHGVYSQKIISVNALGRTYSYIEWTKTETVYARFYVYVTEAVLSTETRRIAFGMFHDKTYSITTEGRSDKLWVGIATATRNWFVLYSDDITASAGGFTGNAINLNQWYCVEMMHTHGNGTTGVYEVFIDGVSIVSWNNLNTDSYKADRFKLGNSAGRNDVNDYGTFYEDCVVIADAYIGPEAVVHKGTIAIHAKLAGVI